MTAPASDEKLHASSTTVEVAHSGAAGLNSDLESLLEIARDLHERVSRRRSQAQTFVLIGLAMALLAVLIFFLGLARTSASFPSEAYLIGAGGGLIYAVMSVVLGLRAHQRTFGDRAALEKVVAIISEVVAASAREQGWSPLTRARYEISLSSLSI